jgi:hypothetical protein
MLVLKVASGAPLADAIGFDQALHGAVARHGDVHARHADQTGLGMADEVHAVHRLEDETERHQADDEDPGAEGHGFQAAERGHAAAAVLDLARLGEVVALQRRQHFADADDVAGQVRGDQVTQGRDVLRFEVLELATGATALAVVGAHLQFDVHGQAEVVDHELQARLVHVADLQRQLAGVERQATGGQVEDPRFDRRAVGPKKRSLAGIFTRACWRWASDSCTTLALTAVFMGAISLLIQ